MSYFAKFKQDIVRDPNNSSVANLDSENSYTFTGVGSSTLGVAGLQWNLITDKNATVCIEQSEDNINWDISDCWDYFYAKGGTGATVQAISSYWRIIVTLTGTEETTYFRLNAVLCPIAEPLPRKLSNYGNLQVVSSLRGDENIDRHVWVNPTSELAVSPVYRLVGTTFDGTTLDPNFWTDNSTLAGEVTQDGGEIELTTNKTVATANSTAIYTSVRRGRFVAGSAMFFNGGVNWVTAGTENNVRRVGAFDSTDGFYFQLNGTTFSLGTRRGGVDTLVNSGSFNGNLGSIFVPIADTYYNISIEYTPLGAFFYVNKRLLHKITAAHLSNTNTLPINIENINSGGITTNVVFDSVGLYIARQGELVTNPTSKYILTGTDVLKYGAGVLQRIIVSDNIGRVIIYDNTAASGTILTNLDTAQGSQPLGSVEFGIPFSTGLTIVITGNVGVTVVYE